MLSRAMTRTILIGSADRAGRSDAGNDRLGRALQSCGEVDARLVAQHLARRGDVRPGVADVAGAGRLEAAIDRLAENHADRLRDVIHARGRACGDVERASARAVCIGSPNRRVDDVADIREVARLLAVTVDRDLLALVDGSDETRNGRGVLRVRALPRAEHVEVSE